MLNKKNALAAESAAPAEKPERENFLGILMTGGRKGLNIWFNNIIPSCVISAFFLAVIEVTGLLDIIGTYLGPVMSIFGLPGEAIVPYASAFISMPAAAMTALPMIANGTLNGIHATILLAMILSTPAVDKMFRMASTAGADGKTSLVCVGLTILCGIISGLMMRCLLLFL